MGGKTKLTEWMLSVLSRILPPLTQVQMQLVRPMLSQTNRINVLWDVEPESYPELSGDSALIVRHVIENVRPGSIILLHVMPQNRQASLAAVPGIVRQLRARGYHFVTVSELLKLRA